MSNFVRKRSIDKRSKGEENSEINTLNTTKTSFRASSSRISSANSKNYRECVEAVQMLAATDLEKIPIDKLDKQVAEVIGGVADVGRGVLISQKLSGFKQSTILITKYNQAWKLQGTNLNEANSALCLGVYKNVSEQLSNITKEEKNDELVLQANLTQAVVGLLDSFVSNVEAEAAKNKEKKPILMRKNSLKKVSEAQSIRPNSRGKLNSLTKKDRLASKVEILEINDGKAIRQKKEGQTYVDTSLATSEQIVMNMVCVLKNLSANKKVRRDLLKEQYLRLINRYLLIWSEKSLNQFGNSMLVQLTSASRHLAAEEKAYRLFLKSNCFQPWTRLVEMFPSSNDIIFNLLRILSKLSANEDCCQKLNQKKQFLKVLSSFFQAYKSHIHIVIRVSFIFANMTSYLTDIRTQLYFDFKAWDGIFECFQFYANSELKGKSEVEKMGISMAAWDLPAMKKQSDVEALMKIVRLIANLFTVPEIGQDIYRQHSNNYRQLIKSLKMLLEKKSNLQKHNQLIACVLSCLTNTLYYDRQLLLASNQYKTVKKQLIQLLVDFVVQIDNEEVCCESLRVVSNLTRMKQFIKPVLEAKLHEAVIILLDSTSKEIVYYSLGIIINLLADEDFKREYRNLLIDSIIGILNECQSEDFDIVGVSLKALSVIIDNRSQNIDPKKLAEIESSLINLGTHCDRMMLDTSETMDRTELQSAQQSRNLINVLLNNMPEQKFVCSVKNCGRKFTEEAKLQEHMSRRHKI